VRHFVEAVAPQGDERALDVACGPGLLASIRTACPRIHRHRSHADMVEKAAATAREVGLSNARFEVLQENVIGDRNKDVDEISLKKENWPESWFWPAAFCCGAAGNRTRLSTRQYAF
jgi:tRNA/tmRNA/rRNA uracil-C5-methylase (TrmA/RlmC/RlmD family)